MKNIVKVKAGSVRKRHKCFTLIEVIVVIAILAILSVIAMPRVTGLIHMVEEQVCNFNCGRAARNYNTHLATLGENHSDSLFSQFILEYESNICPRDYVVTYDNGEVQCSFHNVEDDADDGEVPYL